MEIQHAVHEARADDHQARNQEESLQRGDDLVFWPFGQRCIDYYWWAVTVEGAAKAAGYDAKSISPCS